MGEWRVLSEELCGDSSILMKPSTFLSHIAKLVHPKRNWKQEAADL